MENKTNINTCAGTTTTNNNCYSWDEYNSLIFDYCPPAWKLKSLPYLLTPGSSSFIGEVVSSPKVIKVPAYGLDHDEIKIKEIDGVVTVKSSSKEGNYCATVDKKYTLTNTKFFKSYLSKGVLFLEFVDSPNVIHHRVEKVNE